ncbi:MAG: hypothetical protein Q7Q73_07240 [Verrucomicrobiota bacterium JB024]|nr:hypothetical protein [Verrucomicrobiota bacterium JB024]
MSDNEVNNLRFSFRCVGILTLICSVLFMLAGLFLSMSLFLRGFLIVGSGLSILGSQRAIGISRASDSMLERYLAEKYPGKKLLSPRAVIFSCLLILLIPLAFALYMVFLLPE